MLIYNAKIKTVDDNDTVYENGFIEFENGIITALGEMSGLKQKVTDNDIDIDARGKTLYPGFIDAHCHVGIFGNGLGFEGTDANEITDPVTPHLRAEDSVNGADFCFKEAAEAGITCVVTGVGSANPMGGTMIAMKTADGNETLRADKLILKAPLAIKMALGENPKGTYHERDETPSTRMATAALIREQLYKTKRYLEQCEKHTSTLGTDSETDLPEYDIKCEALIPLLKREIKAHIHCHRTDDIFTAIRLAKEFDFEYVLVHATEGGMIANELAAEKSHCIIGPVICDRSKPELQNLTITCSANLKKAGVEFAICTDHPVAPVQYLPISAGLAVRGGLDKETALRAITINAARILGINDRVGSIETGKDADFVLIDGEFYEVLSKPLLVIIGGEIICRNL